MEAGSAAVVDAGAASSADPALASEVAPVPAEVDAGAAALAEADAPARGAGAEGAAADSGAGFAAAPGATASPSGALDIAAVEPFPREHPEARHINAMSRSGIMLCRAQAKMQVDLPLVFFVLCSECDPINSSRLYCQTVEPSSVLAPKDEAMQRLMS